jgi:HSP20 family protein
VVSSEKEDKNEEKDKKDNFLRREFSYSSFQRSFSLPEGVNAYDIKAKHENGVLYVTIPKKDELKQQPSKKIEIE